MRWAPNTIRKGRATQGGQVVTGDRAVWPGARELEEMGRTPWRLQRERGPAHTLI